MELPAPTEHDSDRASGLKIAIVVSVQLVVALLHVTNWVSGYQGPAHWFITGYLFDIIIPLAFYLLLCLVDASWLSHWAARAGLILAAAVGAEAAQGVGLEMLGSVFDPLDLVAYATGVCLGAALDRIVLSRIVPAWTR